MKNVENNEIIITNEFKNILCNIENDKHPVVILTGARQCGKTTILKEYEKLETIKNNIVLTIDFQKYYNGTLNQKKRETYVELILCKELLDKIKDTSYLWNSMEIQRILFEVERKIRILYDYISSEPYNDSTQKLELISIKGNLLSRIIDVIKKGGIDKIILQLDRFDWIGDSSKYYQQELLSYSNIFDKILVTSDDEDIYYYKDALEKEGINIIKIDYSKKIDFVTKILKEKIKHFKYISMNVYQLFKDDIYKYFINLCNGNIDIMLKIIYEINNVEEFLSHSQLIELIDSEFNKKQSIYSLVKSKKFYINN